MPSIKRRPTGIAFILVAIFGAFAGAVVMTDNRGNWPQDWPESMEPLRATAKTIDVACGTQETVYEIRFADRAAFGKVWPDILSLRTPGAPLILSKTVTSLPKDGVSIFDNSGPAVRIFSPAKGAILLDGGKKLDTQGPWPASLRTPDGGLPEYVQEKKVNGQQGWIAVDNTKSFDTFHYRARTDIELVVDGNVIDLNRLKLPAATPILDKRF